MTTLRIQHAVPNFEEWKRAFDRDPVDRKGGGVRRYRVYRPVDDSKFVMIDLEFDTRDQADGLLKKLRQLWSGPAKNVMVDPRAWIVETVESKEL